MVWSWPQAQSLNSLADMCLGGGGWGVGRGLRTPSFKFKPLGMCPSAEREEGPGCHLRLTLPAPWPWAEGMWLAFFSEAAARGNPAPCHVCDLVLSPQKAHSSLSPLPPRAPGWGRGAHTCSQGGPGFNPSSLPLPSPWGLLGHRGRCHSVHTHTDSAPDHGHLCGCRGAKVPPTRHVI